MKKEELVSRFAIGKNKQVMQIKLTNSTVKILNKMYISSHRSCGLLSLRIVGIFRLAEGYSCAQVAALLQVSVRAVERWRLCFLSKGAAGLPPGKATGSKSKLTEKQKQLLYQIILTGPQASGYSSACWRSPMVAELIAQRFGVIYHPYYIPQLLRSLGLSWQKATFDAAGKDEAKREAWLKERWTAIVEKAKGLNAHILFGDEASFPQWGSLSYTWAAKGAQPVVKTSGRRRGCKVFGAISYHTGTFYTQVHEGKFNSESYQAFLLGVFQRLKRHIIIIHDGARYHTSKAMQAFYQQYAHRLTVEQLPSFSPDYNPIEKVWKEVKKEGTHMKYFPDFDTLQNTVQQTLLAFADKKDKILALCGMYKRMETQLA